MKKTALFVNTGRGSTVDEPAMIKALQEGWIAGAGLDVLETEPVGHNNPLLGMDNVILTAHVASASSRFDPARKRRVGAELALVLGGKWPRACVNPMVLEKSKLQRWQPFSMERGPATRPGRLSAPAHNFCCCSRSRIARSHCARLSNGPRMTWPPSSIAYQPVWVRL